MATKPPPVARVHSQHVASPAAQQRAAAHAAAVQQKQAAHAALVQQHATAAANKRAAHAQALANKQAAHQAAIQARANAKAARLAALNPATAAPAADSLATPAYNNGTVGGASGYGGGYAYPETQADTGADATTGGDSATQAAKKSGLSTKTKIWLGVGAGVVVVGYLGWRRVTAPLRRYRRVKGLVQNIAAGFSNLKREVTA